MLTIVSMEGDQVVANIILLQFSSENRGFGLECCSLHLFGVVFYIH